MYLIVGLGNPGKKYQKTYHNLGFLAVQDAAAKLGAKFTTKECQALTATSFVGGQKVVFAMPQTYMNLSGESVKQLLNKHKVLPQNLVVILDDYDIEKGSLRIRQKGSAGTHNGLKNIVENIGATNFTRIRIGIKDSGLENVAIIDYVLSNIPKSDYDLFVTACQKAASAAVAIAENKQIDAVMREFNG